MPISANSVVRYEVKERKAYVAITRPEAMNALNAEVIDTLTAAFADIERNDEVLVTILSGEGGRAFSTGADLKEMAAMDRNARNPAFADTRRFERAVKSTKPVIAAIDGYALAGGFELALTSDIRIATNKSMFGLPEPKRSLLAAYGLHHLSRMIPLGEALHMQLTGTMINAQRAYQIGLVQGLEPDREALFLKVEALAEEILQCAPLAVQAIKHIVMTGRNLPVEYSYELARPIEKAVYASTDRIEGPKAFSEKRPPKWKMR